MIIQPAKKVARCLREIMFLFLSGVSHSMSKMGRKTGNPIFSFSLSQTQRKPGDVQVLPERTGMENYYTPTSGISARTASHLKKVQTLVCPPEFHVSIAASQEMKQINTGDYCAPKVLETICASKCAA